MDGISTEKRLVAVFYISTTTARRIGDTNNMFVRLMR